MCPGQFFLMEEEFDDLLEQEEPVDDDEIADFFDAIPWCYDQYDRIPQLFFVFLTMMIKMPIDHWTL